MYDWEARVLLRHYLDQGLTLTAIQRGNVTSHGLFDALRRGGLLELAVPKSLAWNESHAD